MKKSLQDWTHNTNNMGFHLGLFVACTSTIDIAINESICSLLGSLMVTTANGTGMSVLDFLCVSQSNVQAHHMCVHIGLPLIILGVGLATLGVSVEVITQRCREFVSVEKLQKPPFEMSFPFNYDTMLRDRIGVFLIWVC
jgi:hypothetical protein